MAPTSTMSNERERKLPPFRSIQDFITDARFTTPTFNEPERLRNRMVQNLLYYQTNYFVVAALALFAVCAISQRDFLHGGLAVAVAVSIYVYANKNKAKIKNFRDENPLVGAIVALTLGLLAIHLSGKMLIFMAGSCFPIIGVLLHSACRMRNISNKFNTLSENLGLTKTPMGVILENLGHSPDMPGRQTTAHVYDSETLQKARRGAAMEEAMQAAAEFRY